MILKQSRTFNPIVQGFGILLLLIVGLSFYKSNYSLSLLLILLPIIYLGIWINFASTHLFVNNKKQFIKSIGLFPLKIQSKVDIKRYDCILIKSEKVSYSTKLIGPLAIINSNQVHEQYTGLYLKFNKKYDFDLLIKADKLDIIKIY